MLSSGAISFQHLRERYHWTEMAVVTRILFLVFVAASVASATSSVKGIVVDPKGGPISGASVLLLDPVDLKVLYETKVVRGTFRIDPIAPQSYFINIKALGFREYADSVSVAQEQAVDMGRITLSLGRLEEWFGGEPTLSAEDLVDAHVRTVFGYRVMTVCEYLNLRSATPLSYGFGVILIGILVETPQGSWLRQSCRDSLRSGDYSWPNAIALEPKPGYQNIPGNLDWANFLPHLARPSNEELDPKDREGRWVAFFGPLQTRGKLVAIPCGNGRQCAYGFGTISAPALLLYQKSHEFGGTK
jgi:hypothetical protein